MAEMPIAVVTGASRGIGRAIAKRLAVSHRVVAVARSRPPLDSLADEIGAAGGQCRAIELDITERAAVDAALWGIDAQVLVNNAGIGVLKPFVELTPEEWHRTIDVNLHGVYYATRALLPGMLARGRGEIVNIASLAGKNAFAGGTCYAATKHALLGFTESLMLEVRAQGVRVSAVLPGSVDTEFSGRRGASAWKLAAEDVAESVAHIIAAPANAHVSAVEMRPSRPPAKH